MDTNDQVIALMESLGWTHPAYSIGHFNGVEQFEEAWVDPQGVSVQLYDGPTSYMEPYGQTPDLTLDLLATAEATLTDDESRRYIVHLHQRLIPRTAGLTMTQEWMPLIRATKEQRLESYLRVKGLYLT